MGHSCFIAGADFSVHGDDQIARLKRELQDHLRRLYSFASEGITERWQRQPLEDVYTQLDVTYGTDVSPDGRHEVLQMETCPAAAKQSILPCDIFKSPDGNRRPIRTMLTVGFAGIGKTFLVQKFVCDWASGNTNQDVHFIFPFTFRELNTNKGKRFTLAELIRCYVCESRHMGEETLNIILDDLQKSGKQDYESSRIKILFILDGLDECNFKMNLKNTKKVGMDVKVAYPLEVLLAHLIKGNLLPCARVWITTRPTAARDIPSNLIDSSTVVRGFSDSRRLQYFRKKFPNEERVIEHIQKSRTIFIMCHIPMFCWLTATVLQDHLDKGKEGELPTTLTDMYSALAGHHLENSKERNTTEHIPYVKVLAKLAFHHTMNNRRIFYEKDLVDGSFDYSEAAKHCGLFTEVFNDVHPLRRKEQDKMFQFIHLTIQEYLAALYVMMCLFHDNKNVLNDSGLSLGNSFSTQTTITDVHKSALKKASESEGHLDLFLRFLIGLSLPCNQELLGELLKAPQGCGQSKSKTVELIKKKIKQNTPEKNINLFYCLNELKDNSLQKQIQQELDSGRLSWRQMSNEMWSALAFFLFTDEETMKSFILASYSPSPLGLEKLLLVVKASQKSVLANCDLDKRSCHLMASVLNAPSNLRHLDLSVNNNVSDEGVEILSKGLASPHCILQVLKLSQCGITSGGCVSLAEALKLNPIHLQELDLSGNNLSDEGVEILSKGLASPRGILKVLRLYDCGITNKGCISLAKVLKVKPCHLQELILSDNRIEEEGKRVLLEIREDPSYSLKTVKRSASGSLQQRRYWEAEFKGKVYDVSTKLCADVFIHMYWEGPSKKELLGELLKAPQDCGQSKLKAVKLIKERIKRNPPEKDINLFYCLNELKDASLLKQFQNKCDDETMKSFYLGKYVPLPLELEKLLLVVKASQKSNGKLPMANNRCIGQQPITSLSQKPKKNPQFYEDFKGFMDRVIQKGNDIQVVDDQLNSGLPGGRMALDSEQKKLLLKTLMDLGVRKNPLRVYIADKLVIKRGENTLDETIKILEKIGNKNLVKMLRRNMLEIRGTVHYDVQIAIFKDDLQDKLRDVYSFVHEGNIELWQKQPLADVYTELDVTYGADVSPDERHEVLQLETRAAAANQSILPCDIFKNHDGKTRPIRTLLTIGFAGIGKTFLVQKFVCDWASRNTNQDVHFIFPFTFRELNTDKGKNFTLAKLIRRYVCESRHMSEETLNNIFAELQMSGKQDYESSGIKILFVLDGLDECNFEMDLKNEMKVDMNVTEAYPLEMLLAHLIKRNLLPCARVWITARPATARDIPSHLIDSIIEVRGFSDSRRLDYFRKKFPNEERVIEHIRKTRTIFIMCCMPIFCWLTAKVLQDHLDLKRKEEELPTTLTDMYSRYVFHQLKSSEERQMTDYIHDLKALAKLAFHHTMNKSQIFYENDLTDSGFDYSQAAKHCGIFTKVFKEVRPLKRNQPSKMFQFVHLTVQEYLAAFHVMICLFLDNKNILADSELALEGIFQEEESEEPESEEEVERESEDEGKGTEEEVETESEDDDEESLREWRKSGPVLRFLFGLSLPCNQELVGELLKAPQDCRQSKSWTVKLIKERIKRNPPEKNINLFSCLNELKDDSLLKQVQRKIESKYIDWDNMQNDMWSALAFFLMTDDETMKSFDLSKYNPSPLGLKKLLVVVKASQKSALRFCNLDKHSCHLLASVLSSPSNLRHLDLSGNDLSYEGVEILSKGLASPRCILQVLRLINCGITKRGCAFLAEALQLNPSRLQELVLSGNHLSDVGVKILSKGLASPHCILQVLDLWDCKLRKGSCHPLASVLSTPSNLKHLDLSENNLSDEGVEILSKGLASTHCKLESLNLHDCNLKKGSCRPLASVLRSSSNLKHLILYENDLSDEGVEILSKGLASPHCILESLELSSCKITNKGCVFLAEALKLNPSHLKELYLTDNQIGYEGERVLLDVQWDLSNRLNTVW
nr:uncharacterized protein LOC133588062 [Nerophis lumbriciformis]